MGLGAPGLDMGSFQQPFVPQDLWQMPMTLEWDWADVTGYTGGFEDAAMAGIGMNGVLNEGLMPDAPAHGHGRSPQPNHNGHHLHQHHGRGHSEG